MPIGMGAAMLGSSLIGAGAGLGGGLMSNSFSAKQASKNRRFQEYMSNTAHQRAVADMRAAGLNPVLAAGNPASTPGGSMASGVNLGQTMAQGASTAIQAKGMSHQVRKVDAEATSAKYAAKWEKDVYNYAKNNPVLKDAAIAGMLTKRSTGSTIGSLVAGLAQGTASAVNSAKDALTGKWIRGKDYNSAKSAWEEQRDNWINDMMKNGVKTDQGRMRMYFDKKSGTYRFGPK